MFATKRNVFTLSLTSVSATEHNIFTLSLTSVSATKRNVSYLELSFKQVDVTGTDDHRHRGVQPARIRHKGHLKHIKQV